MGGVIDRLGPNVLRVKRGRCSARFQLDANNHVSDADRVAVDQDALAKSGLISVDEGSVHARQIADSHRVVVHQQHAVMPADGMAVEHQVTIVLAAEDELAARNLKRLSAERPRNDVEASFPAGEL